MRLRTAPLSRRSFLSKSSLAAGTVVTLSAPAFSLAAEGQPIPGNKPVADLTANATSSEPFRLPMNQPQHFFDDSQIGYQRKLVRRWLPAHTNPNPVMVGDRPWEEGSAKMQGSILAAPGGGYRMYYSGGGKVLVALSDDGLDWHKPELDICPFEGKRSNILLEGHPWSIAAASEVYDPQDEKHPYKLTSYQRPDKTKPGALYAYKSADGLRFDPIPGPRFIMGDANTVMDSRVNGKFVGFIRHRKMFDTVGVRSVFRTESSDLLDWSEPKLVLAPDLQDEPDIEFYSMSVFRRNGWFIGLLQYWYSDQDFFETQLAFSRDGWLWQRPQPRSPFISRGYDWNQCGSNCAYNGPLFLNEQMAFYFSGSNTAHHSSTTSPKNTVIGLASLEVDRFCALEGTTEHGWVDTLPLIWPGGSLVVNADTRESFTSHPTKANGELFVEVLDEAGKQLPEWCAKKRAIFQGNTHCREKISDGTVRWPGGRNLDEFTGHAIRLRFGMKHARLFTFEAKSSV